MSSENNSLYGRIYGPVLTILSFLLSFQTQKLQFYSFWTLCMMQKQVFFSPYRILKIFSLVQEPLCLGLSACLSKSIQTIMDVLSILKWTEALYMSLQYIFNANKVPFFSSTFVWLFDSSTLQCSTVALLGKYLEFYWSIFPRIWTEL